MSSVCLVLLTKSYPFDSGEEFIENELPVLSQYFQKIYILSTAVTGEGVQTRSLPDNVSCIKIKETKNKYTKYIKYCLKGAKHINKSQVRRELSSAPNVPAKIASLYFTGRCNSLKNIILSNKDLYDQLESYDRIILYSYWFSDLPYLAVLLKEYLANIKVTLVSRAHGYDLYEDRNIGGIMPYRGQVLKYIDHIYPCSKNGEEYLKEKYPGYSDKIDVSYLGTIDFGFAKQKAHDMFRIVTCSAIISLKRLDKLLDAIRLLNDKGFILEWTCIGDGPLLEELRIRAASEIKQSRVIFKGRLTNQEVMELYKTEGYDLFVNVSETEGLPVSIMEAISFGIPVLATDVGGTGEIVKDGITGKLIKRDFSINELANAIIELVNSQHNRDEIREFWLKNFSAINNYEAFVKDILRIMGAASEDK